MALESKPPPSENSDAIPAGLTEVAPGLIAAFRLPDLTAVYVNPTGRRHLDPKGTATLADFPLTALLGLSSLDRFRHEIHPRVQVLGKWTGTLGLRTLVGSESSSRVTLLVLTSTACGGESRLGVFASLPDGATAENSRPVCDEDMLHALLESLPEVIYFKDTASRFLRISRAHANLFHLHEPQEAIGKTDFDFFTAAHAAPAFRNEQEILRTGEPLIDFEEKETFADGRFNWVSTTKLPFRNREGKLIGTFGVSRNITARKAAEEALRESEVLFRSIFEGSNDAILLLTDQGIIDCNPRTLEMFGYTKEQLIGLLLESISPPRQPDGRDSAAASREYVGLAFTKGHCRFDWVHRRADQTNFPTEVLLSAFDFGAKRILQATVRDITERKRAEAEHREMEAQLLLAQKLESVGRLAAGVAHEINTPTQFVSDNVRFLITAFAQLDRVLASHQALIEFVSVHPEGAALLAAVRTAEEENERVYLSGEIPRTLEQSLEGLTRIAKIVGSLKEFSHPGGTEKSGADLNRAIETTIAVSRHEWKYVAEVVTELAPQLPAVPCVLDEINQVVLNLIVNAAHAIGEANRKLGRVLGRITVRTRLEPGWAILEVEDNGTGIPSEVQKRIFEPFFTTKGIGKGTGQGLTIVRNVVVKAHGGRLDLTTEVGKGTTFRIALPLAPAPDPAATDPESEP